MHTAPCLAYSVASISPYGTVSRRMAIISRQMPLAITRLSGITNWPESPMGESGVCPAAGLRRRARTRALDAPSGRIPSAAPRARQSRPSHAAPPSTHTPPGCAAAPVVHCDGCRRGMGPMAAPGLKKTPPSYNYPGSYYSLRHCPHFFLGHIESARESAHAWTQAATKSPPFFLFTSCLLPVCSHHLV